MLDVFTAQPTRIRGRALPSGAEREALQDDHERRLAALTRLGAAAEKCGLRADSDRDLALLAEDEVSLLEASGPEWAELGETIRAWRALVPLRRLEDFGFPSEAENPLEEPNLQLQRIGGGVEAWAFAAREDGSVYKFYLPREEKRIGSVFGFRRAEVAAAEASLHAEATLGDYRALLEKLLLIQALGGMATEIIAITPEGIVVAKQTLGDPLPQGDDVSRVLPDSLIEIPSRFLRANRDHPRLFFIAAARQESAPLPRSRPTSARDGSARAFLVADLHARNFVRDITGELRVIDIVAAPWPADVTARDPWMNEWFERVRTDPSAGMLPTVADDEL